MKNILYSFREIILDATILLFIGCIPLLWIPDGFVVTGHDAGYPITIPSTYIDRLYAWNNGETFGKDNTVNLSAILIHSIEAGFHSLGFSTTRSETLTFVFWFLSMLFSMYFFSLSLKRYFPYRYFALMSAVLYGVNFYLLALWKYGAGTTFSAYSALPLVMAFFLRFVMGKDTIISSGLKISFTILIFNGGGGLSIPLFGGLMASLGVALIYFLMIGPKSQIVSQLGRLILLFLWTLVVSLIINAYWLLPFYGFVVSNFSSSVAGQGGYHGIIAWADVVSKSTSMMNLFRLQGFPDWYENVPHAYAARFLNNPLLIFMSFLFPVLAYASLFFREERERKKIILYFVFLSLTGLFLSSGTHPPTGSLFAFLLVHIPGFVVFRSAQYKFIPALYFSFAVLISYTLSIVLTRLTANKTISPKKTSFITGIAVMGIISVILMYHFPYFSRRLFEYNASLTTLLKIPHYVLNYEQEVSKIVRGSDRILLLPMLNTTWHAEKYTWGYYSLDSLFNKLTPIPYVENSMIANEAQQSLMNTLSHGILTSDASVGVLTSILGIKYALVRNDVDYTSRWNPMEDPKIYLEAFTRSGNEKIWESGKWAIYSLPQRATSPKIFGLPFVTEFIGPATRVGSAVSVGMTEFIQREEGNNSDGISVPIQYRVFSVPCESCKADATLPNPDISSRILPGSLLHFVKLLKEKQLDSPSLPPSELYGNRLGLTLKRAVELESLAYLKRNPKLIYESAQTLEYYWNYISDTFRSQQNTPDQIGELMKTLSYARNERRILNNAYIHVVEIETKRSIQRTLDRIEQVIDTADARRSFWDNRKAYSTPKEYSTDRVFLEASSLISNNGIPHLPDAIETDSGVYPIHPTVRGGLVSVALPDIGPNKKFSLHFPDVKNLLTNIRIKDVIGPNDPYRCVVGDIDTFQEKYSYRLKLQLLRALSPDVRLFLRKYQDNSETDLSSRIDYLARADQEFTLDSHADHSDRFVIQGESGDKAASIYFCTKNGDTPELYVKSLSVQQITSPNLLFVPKESEMTNPLRTPVNFTQVNQTKYNIGESNNTYPMILVLNENYANGWNIYDIPLSRDRGWISEFIETWFVRPVQKTTHFRLYGYANAWYITDKPKGKLILEYTPQQQFYKGVIITVGGIAVAIIVMVLISKRRKP